MISRVFKMLCASTIGLGCLTAFLADVALLASQVEQTDEDRAEYNVKLAYLCKFSRYVEWMNENMGPPERNTWIIGVLGADPFHGELDQLAAEQRLLSGRKIMARHFSTMQDYQPCHVLFIPKTVSAQEQLAAIVALRGRAVLVVGETAGFASRGGCINFFREGDNIRFEINMTALRDQKLQAGAVLQKIGKSVEPASP